MTCLLTNGITKGCRDNIGGISTVYLANKELLTSVTVGGGSPEDLGLVSAIATQSSIGADAPAFYEFQVNKNSSNWVDTGTVVASNGGTFYAPAVTMVFGKNDSTKLNTVKLMGQSTLVAIVKNNDGKYFILGETNGLELSAGAYASGTAFADLNGWTITLSGGETHPAYEVPSTLITSAIIVGMA